jgi:hypothetical protein
MDKSVFLVALFFLPQIAVIKIQFVLFFIYNKYVGENFLTKLKPVVLGF